jgi:hypothetical protein
VFRRRVGRESVAARGRTCPSIIKPAHTSSLALDLLLSYHPDISLSPHECPPARIYAPFGSAQHVFSVWEPCFAWLLVAIDHSTNALPSPLISLKESMASLRSLLVFDASPSSFSPINSLWAGHLQAHPGIAYAILGRPVVGLSWLAHLQDRAAKGSVVLCLGGEPDYQLVE